MKKNIKALFALLCFVNLSAASAANTDKWDQYIDGTIGKPIYYMLNNLPPEKNCDAVDFGSGAGNEVVELLKNGCHVLGIDVSPHSGEVIQTRQYLIPHEGSFDFQAVDFARAQLYGKYDLFISYFSLPWGKKEDLDGIFNNITTHAKPHARISMSFFGPEHTFVKQGIAYGVTKDEIEKLLIVYRFLPNYILHRQFKQKDFDGNDVFWDIIDVDATLWD